MGNFTEADIKTKYILPAIKNAGWDLQTQVREEVSFTHGSFRLLRPLPGVGFTFKGGRLRGKAAQPNFYTVAYGAVRLFACFDSCHRLRLSWRNSTKIGNISQRSKCPDIYVQHIENVA